MNFLDRVIAVLNPEAGLRRASLRKRTKLLDQMPEGRRRYEGDSRGRLSGNWLATGTDADTLIASHGRGLRARSRDLGRNSAIAARIFGVHADYIVGTGIKPRSATGDADLDRRVDALFAEAARNLDADGQTNFYGLQYRACRGMVEGGEMFGRRRPRRLSDGLPVPMQVQLLEPEMVDESKIGSGRGRYIKQGIEFDSIGRRRGYWFHKQNPYGSTMIPSVQGSSFVPADEVVHLFEGQRVQIRGIPWIAPVMADIRDFDEYCVAEDVRKKTEACLVGIVIPGADDAEPILGIAEDDARVAEGGEREPGIYDANGNPFERFEPGMFGYAHGGQDVKFNSPAMTTGQESYLRTRQRKIAAGARMPYELLTGDFSQANFASGKLGLLAYYRFVTVMQQQLLIPQFCQPIWDWVIDAAVGMGQLPDRDYPAIWQPPEFDSITRIDDARADLIEVRSGTRSLTEVIQKKGRNPDEVLDEIATTNAKIDEKGLTLDSDPRKIALNGQLQFEEGGENAGTE